ncbi:hypothetical protein SAMN06265375_103340 [Muriicola jejuensis]|uniref:Uncharacterized protein n=1 Tax=Muriicola jejuensis TaxID=504488 RepID=A0A6P0UDM8_9FLAO|nr:hypothetical protein [Muriicola jejuensis]SMP21609.1 hypothetical protein SAMN06265375_103340 [Muriicola jejuensis]
MNSQSRVSSSKNNIEADPMAKPEGTGANAICSLRWSLVIFGVTYLKSSWILWAAKMAEDALGKTALQDASST